MKFTRQEYPRPQFRRDEWLPLNGEWEFSFGDGNTDKTYPAGATPLKLKINVPFTYQYGAGGVDCNTPHDTVWYRRTFNISSAQAGKGCYLCFNGSDYETCVWINGSFALSHTGGFSPFKKDVSQYLKEGENVIVVRCYDPDDPAIPRGKQSWTGEKFACWYVPNTGIWQSVWLEFFGADAIESYTLAPDIDTLSFSGEIETLNGCADGLEISVSYGGKPVKKQVISLDGKRTRYTVRLMESDFVDESTYWTIEKPNLYYIDFTLLCGGKVEDVAHTRFGMRKISIDASGTILLNNRPLYQRLILDQGYWEGSGLTPPSAEALKEDILLAQSMGFNGARKHQKFEDPYFYYYAEELGFLVWCEMPSAYHFCAGEVKAITAQWQDIISVARNFTSVICYVPLNESWGVRKILNDESQINFARSLYFLTKSLDGGKLVSTNDGWENTEETDVVSVHDYAYDGDGFTAKYYPENYSSLYPQGRKLIVEGGEYLGQPVLFTEFGGIALKGEDVGGNWGYNAAAENCEQLYARLENLMRGINACGFQGFCYTQLTDVQQEVNGLAYADRTPKADIKRLKKIFGGK